MTNQPSVAVSKTTATNSVEFIGNATVLLRLGPFTILTDPNFVHEGEKVSLGYGLTATRLTDPSLEIDELPDLDLIVLSHYHGDHFDQVAEAELDGALPILTTPQAADILRTKGFAAAAALETWESRSVERRKNLLKVTAMPGRHAPGALTVALPDVMGSLIELWTGDEGHDADETAPPSLRLYISGDTLMYEGLREIPQRHPEIDVALLHLGGTRVMGLTVTMDAEQGAELIQALKPRLAIPIHYDDYDAFKSPLSDFVSAVRVAGLQDQVRYLDRGERLALS